MTTMSVTPLDDIRVLDLTHFINGPYATMLLGYMGAEIVKIEAPRYGDGFRPLSKSPGHPFGLPFAMMNLNKRAITLDLKSARGKEIFKRLVARADLVVENYAAGTMTRMGLDYGTLSRINPRLIYASGTGYGQTGPNSDLPAFDPIVQANTGLMAVTGEKGGPPLKSGAAVVDVLGAVHLCAAILGAIRERDRSGKGLTIEVAMQEATLPTLVAQIGAWYGLGNREMRNGNRAAGGGLTPYNAYPASDGWVMILAGDNARWRRLCQVIGRPQMADDPRFAKLGGRIQNRDLIDEAISEWTRGRTREAIMEELSSNDVLCGIVRELPEVMDDPHLEQRGALRMVEHPELGSMKVFGSPLRFNGEVSPIKSLSPGLGADNDDFYARELNLSVDEIAELRAEGII